MELRPTGLGGQRLVLVLMLVVRPIAVGVATGRTSVESSSEALSRLAGTARIVTASVASLFAIRLEQAGILGAGRLQGLVFLTILMTVGLQGLTAQPLARALGLIEESCEATTPSGETTLQPGRSSRSWPVTTKW